MKKTLCFLITYILILNIASSETTEIENIKVRVGDAKIVFDSTSEQIILPEGITYESNNRDVYIYPEDSDFLDNTVGKFLYKIKLLFGTPKYKKIVIGTKKRYNKVDLNILQGIIVGEVKAEKFEIDGIDLIIKGKIDSSRIIIDGNYMGIIPKNTTVDIEGELSGDSCYIDSYKIKTSIKVTKFENIEIEGRKIDANIEYQDVWENKRYLSVNGNEGKVGVWLNKGSELDIEIKNGLKKEINYNEE